MAAASVSIDWRRSIEERCMPEPNTGCWLWLRAVDKNGYGKIGKRSARAHRASFEAFHGVSPGRLFVLHHCDTPSCVNPDHLFLGTAADNAADRDTKGRHRAASGETHGTKKQPWCVSRGELHPHAILTVEDVTAIRADRRLYREIAVAHGVSVQTVCKVKNRLSWRHVP